MYWQTQYERVAQHENGRYQVSAFVLAGSLVALGVISAGDDSAWVRWVAALSVAAINLLAVVFIRGERRWVKVHQNRAAAALLVIAPDLVAIQGTVNEAAGLEAESSHRNALLRSANTLSLMHVVVASATVLLAIAGGTESQTDHHRQQTPSPVVQ